MTDHLDLEEQHERAAQQEHQVGSRLACPRCIAEQWIKQRALLILARLRAVEQEIVRLTNWVNRITDTTHECAALQARVTELEAQLLSLRSLSDTHPAVAQAEEARAASEPALTVDLAAILNLHGAQVADALSELGYRLIVDRDPSAPDLEVTSEHGA